MDLRALHYFVAVYENGSLSAASKVCFVAQPSISAAIRQLEQDLEQPLFVRHAKGVRATVEGEQLYPLARQLLGQADAIRQLFRSSSEKLPFRLGLIKGLGVERMSGLLKDFTAAEGGMELTLVPHDESCDARIISADIRHKSEEFLPMWQEKYLLALPVNHPLALKSSISLFELEGLPFIHRLSCDVWPVFRDKLNLLGIHLDIRANIQTVEYAIGLVKAGLGAALLPVIQEDVSHRDIVCRGLDELNLTRDVGLAYEQGSQGVSTLKSVIRSS